MFNTIVGAGAVGAGAGAASRYGSGSDQKMRLLAALAPQHWFTFMFSPSMFNRNEMTWIPVSAAHSSDSKWRAAGTECTVRLSTRPGNSQLLHTAGLMVADPVN
jgi:hypothetical protein